MPQAYVTRYARHVNRIAICALVAIGCGKSDTDVAPAREGPAAKPAPAANRPLGSDELARLRTIAPELAATVATFQREWSVATTPAALHAVTTTSRPCPVTVMAPSFEAGDHYVKTGDRNANEMPLDVPRVMRGAAVPPPDFAAMRGSADAIAQRVAGGSVTRADLDAANQLYAPDGVVTFFVAIEDKPPRVTDDNAYESGRVYGTAYIYDLALGAVVCAAKVDVQNSPGIKFDFITGSAHLADEAKALERDLDVRTQRAIASAIRATPAAAR
jgi:hypothetical protein